MNVKKLLRKIVDFFYFPESLSFFLVMTDENKVLDYCWVLGGLARKSNEVDYAFEQYVRYHLKHTRSDLYIPPYRILRYDFPDVSQLPLLPEDPSDEFTNKIFLPWIMEGELRPVKDLDFRGLHFAIEFGVYSLDAVCSTTGIERTESHRRIKKRYIVNRILQADLDEHRSYGFYLKMLALQDERHRSSRAVTCG